MGEESAAKERKTGGSALAWEQPMKVVQHADHWISQRPEDEDLSQAIDSQSSDSSGDSGDDSDGEAGDGEDEAEEEEEPQPRGGRGGQGSAREKRKSSALDVDGDDEVEVIVALSRELMQDPLYHAYVQ